MRPREKAKAQLDRGGIQAEPFGFETEFVLGRMRSAQAVHFCEQVFEKIHGT